MRSYIESWAAKRARKADFDAGIAGFDRAIKQKLSFAYAREADKEKQAVKAFKHAAGARIATKKYYRDIEEAKIGERGWIRQAARTRARKAELKATEKVDKAKSVLAESRHNFVRLQRESKFKAEKYEAKSGELVKYREKRGELWNRKKEKVNYIKSRTERKGGWWMYYEIMMCPDMLVLNDSNLLVDCEENEKIRTSVLKFISAQRAKFSPDAERIEVKEVKSELDQKRLHSENYGLIWITSTKEK